ncbi:PorV/PorQ family protein [Elusimicrobiota bacterium]
MYKKIPILIMLVLTVNTVARGSLLEGKGETIFPFLKINPSVESAAYSGSNAAIIEGAQAAFLNPAGLASAEKTGFYALYTRWLDDINIGYVSSVYQLEKYGNLGVCLGYMQYPDLKVIEEDAASEYGYSVKNTFSASSGYGGVSISKYLSTNLMGGCGLKFVGEKIGSYASASTLAMDCGIIGSASPEESYGLSVSNLSWGARFKDKLEPLPVIIRAAGSWSYTQIQGKMAGWKYGLTLGSELRFKDGLYIMCGLDISPGKIISIRGGYNYALESDDLGAPGGASFGLGLGDLEGVRIEYSLASFGRLGLTHRIGINF